MKKCEYDEFKKRYDKFKNNNLPTPFWDNERETLEYVYYDSELYYWKNLFNSDKLNVTNSLTESLGNIANAGFYYSYTCGDFSLLKDNLDYEFNIMHRHGHSFEDVVRSLYEFPESFKIMDEDKVYYSKQELDYLRRVQNYLLFIGLKDLESPKISVKRYRNKLQNKYGIASVNICNDKVLEDFISGKRNFRVIVPDNISIYEECMEYPNHDRKELLLDKNEKYRLFIEYTHREIKIYKDIKEVYKNDLLKDNDKVVLEYFKILERFN